MSLEVLGISVAVVFGILAIVVAYPEGRMWLKTQIGKLATAWSKIIVLLNRLRNRSIDLLKDALVSPKKLTLVFAFTLITMQILIAWINDSIPLLGIVFSPTVIDAIIGGLFSILLLAVLTISIRVTSVGSTAYIKHREHVGVAEDMSAQLEKRLQIAKEEYKAKLDVLELTLEHQRINTTRLETILAYLADRDIPIPENLSDLTDIFSTDLPYRVMGAALERLPDEIQRKPRGSSFLIDSDWEAYGSGDYTAMEILNIVQNLGADVRFFVRLNNLVLVRNRVFAAFTRDFPNMVLGMKDCHALIDLAIHRTSMLNELKERNNTSVMEDSDLPLRIGLKGAPGHREFEEDELRTLLSEAYRNA